MLWRLWCWWCGRSKQYQWSWRRNKKPQIFKKKKTVKKQPVLRTFINNLCMKNLTSNQTYSQLLTHFCYVKNYLCRIIIEQVASARHFASTPNLMLLILFITQIYFSYYLYCLLDFILSDHFSLWKMLKHK
jgi:hypothetical protein